MTGNKYNIGERLEISVYGQVQEFEILDILQFTIESCRMHKYG